jgi:uncharacterized protein
VTSEPPAPEPSGPVQPGPLPSAEQPPPRWGIPTAIGSLLGFIILSNGVVIGLSTVGVDSTTAQIVAILVGWLSLGGWPLLAARRRGNGPRSDFALAFRPRDLGIGLLAALVVYVAGAVYLVVYLSLTGAEPTSALGTTAEGAGASWQVVVLAVQALCAPFVEELHFRGLWWGALRRRGLAPWLTLLVTALLFAVVHFEPTRAVFLFAAGLACGFVRLRTGRLGPAIVTHFLVNLLAAVGLLSLL